MVNLSKLTNEMEKQKDHFQCYYHNRGYCKFGNQCHYQHYSESCPKTICLDKQCMFRHPKMCRNSINCKFFKRQTCMYRHHPLNELKPKNVLSNNIKMLEEEVKRLEREIENLKLDLKTKEDIIAKESDASKQYKVNDLELNKMKQKYQTKENECETLLEDKFKLSKINETLEEEIKHLKAAKVELLPNYACDECDFHAGTLKELLIHIRLPHMPKTERLYNCVECKITFKKRFDLIIHHSVKHPGKNDITTGKYHHVV